MSRQGIYRHFASKEALFVATAEELHRNSLAQSQLEAAKVRVARGDVVETLVAAICARMAPYLAYLVNAPHATELTMEHNRQCGALIETYRQRSLNNLIEIVDGFCRSGALRLKDGITSTELAVDATTVALGLINALPPKSPQQFRDDLTRIVRRLKDGAAR